MGDSSVTRSFIGGCAMVVLLMSCINGCNSAIRRPFGIPNDFPPDFIFGAGTSAYQVEGAAFIGGRGMSTWDVFAHTPGKIVDNSTGNVAIEQYYRYEEDLRLVKAMGMKGFKFTISWPRIFPNGAPRNSRLNEEGVAYYDRLINATIALGLEPYATLFHWDLPVALEYEYGGLRSRRFVQDFHTYANACFSLFGDRVKHWTTINEPGITSWYGYDLGLHAPGRCSPCFTAANDAPCLAGDSAVEPYTVAHNLLLAHSAAAKLYKTHFKPRYNGSVGITLLSQWYVPYNVSQMRDHEAAIRSVDFLLGWFLEPLTIGRYPPVMRQYVKDRLPVFTDRESHDLKNSLDFLGINYYTSQFALDKPDLANVTDKRYSTDALVLPTYTNASGDPIGPPSQQYWLHVYPEGIYHVLRYAARLTNISIYITENGYPEDSNSTSPIPSGYTYNCSDGGKILPRLNDTERVDYYKGHLSYIQQAMSEGSNVKGYFGWSLTDSFEWNGGFSARFGLHYVDYLHNLTRYDKLSACWFKSYIEDDKSVPTIGATDPASHSSI